MSYCQPHCGCYDCSGTNAQIGIAFSAAPQYLLPPCALIVPPHTSTTCRRYDYSCETALEHLNGKVCGIIGPAVEGAATCNADPTCQAITYFPLGREYVGEKWGAGGLG